jgi:drug/metabolite transporter (DMT)-like permease
MVHVFPSAILLRKETSHNMNKPLAIALLAAGIILAVWGVSATNSFSSDVSRFFTGSPTNKAMWLLIGGIVLGIVGLLGLGLGSRKS